MFGGSAIIHLTQHCRQAANTITRIKKDKSIINDKLRDYKKYDVVLNFEKKKNCVFIRPAVGQRYNIKIVCMVHKH